MKRLVFFPILLILLFSACGEKDKSKTVTAVNNTLTKIEVIDFYGTHRCVTCEAIEANAKYTVEEFFPEEVKNGKLEFKTVNVDDDKNYSIAESFEATGTALFLNVIKNGKEHHIDFTEFAFANGKDKEAFSAQLKEIISEHLKTL